MRRGKLFGGAGRIRGDRRSGRRRRTLAAEPLERRDLLAVIPLSQAVVDTLPPVPGDGVGIEVFNGIGGGSAPTPALLSGRTPTGTTLSPFIDFPNPGGTVNVGQSFNNFFQTTTRPPDQLLGVAASNFVLRNQMLLRVSRDLDRNPATPEIDLRLGVGSDDGYHLTVGTTFLGQTGDRAFTYSWHDVSFEDEGLYPVTLLFAANSVGFSGLEFSWATAATGSGSTIVPQSALYLTTGFGDRLITFEEYAAGTAIDDHYRHLGVLFDASPGLQVTNAKPNEFVPVSPGNVFGDPAASPAELGELNLSFVVPGTEIPATTDFFSFFIIDAEATGATVTAYDALGGVLFQEDYHGGGATQELVTIDVPRIARVHMTLGQGGDTSAIDNVRFANPQPMLPDLTLAATLPALLSPGMAGDASWTVTNCGLVPATAAWEDRIYLSTDATLGADDLLLWTEAAGDRSPLAGGEGYTVTRALDLPPSVAAGSYYLLVVADAGGDQAEEDETNNLVASPVTVERAPAIVAHSPSGHTQGPVTGIDLTLSAPVLGAAARDPASYEVLDLGADYAVGGGDDQILTLVPSYVDGTQQIELLFTSDSAASLNAWGERDYSNGSAGNWQLQTGGTSVFQSVNGSPTFFVSDFDFLDRQFTGRVRMDNDGDDDFVGLTFGFQTDGSDRPDSYYVFTWKRNNQDVAERGFKLLKVVNSAGLTQNTIADLLWNGENGSVVTVLARDNSLGWNYNTDYEFSLRYQSSGAIDLTIRQVSNGAVLWSTSVVDPEPLGTGKVGFYNYSQSRVTYSGLRQVEFLDEGAYQIRARSGDPGLRSATGVPLDGNNDGYAGDGFITVLVVDRTPPRVVATAIAAPSIEVDFFDRGGIDPATVTDPANYHLVSGGGDGILGNGNDVVIPIAGVTYQPGAGGAGRATLSFGDALPDDRYQLTIAGAGIRDLAGLGLDGGQDVQAELTLISVPAEVYVDLRAQDDSGSSDSDNVTNVTAPSFDVTVNKAGRIEVDLDGDGLADQTLVVTAAGTVTFTAPPLSDGTTAVTAVFTPVVGSAAQDTLLVTIDTRGPRVASADLAGDGATGAAFLDIAFDSAIDAATFAAADVVLTGPSGSVALEDPQPLSATVFRLLLADPLETGLYSLQVGPAVFDLAGNAMDQDDDGVGGEPGDDVFVTSFNMALPDLAVENVAGPRYAFPGASALVSWDVVNRGSVPPGGSWTERVLLRNEATGSEVLVGVFRWTDQSLPASERIQRTDLSVTLPTGIATGQWRWLVRADDDGEVAESDETNNTALSALDVTVPVRLSLSAASTRFAENAPPQTARVSRSGSTAEALIVTLHSSDASELLVPATVTIPAGQSWAEFPMTPVQDGLPDGDQSVAVLAKVVDAAGADDPRYSSEQLVVVITDSAVPSLILELSADEVSEGGSVTATVTRDVTLFRTEQVVVLSAEGTNQLSLPATVTIPADAASAEFVITAVADNLVEIDRLYRITASGYGTGQAVLMVRDANRKDLELTTRDATVPENAAGLATVGTVRRPVVTSQPQVVALESSDASRLQVPALVTIPANQESVQFPITTTDNFVQGDSARITIRGFAVDPVDRSSRIQPGGSVEVLVQDNDSPTLIVTLDRGLISESAAPPAATGTVRRNTQDLSQELVVQLLSSDEAEAVPGSPTVTIPAGAESAEFAIHAVDDFTPDGNQIVTIFAEAAGFTGGSARLVVSDVDKPDLRIAAIEAPASSYTGQTIIFRFTLVNEGRQPASGPWVDRVYLSQDAWLDAGDVVLGSFAFAGVIGPGESVTRSVPLALPQTAGSFYAIVATDVGFAVDEVLENNNQRFSDRLQIEAAYTVTVSTDVTQAVMGTPVPLAGRATLAESGQPAANVPVAVRVVHEGGFVRTLQATTDAAGDFTAVFTPLANEAGDYQVAAAHPGVPNPPSQDAFTLIGMRVQPNSTSHQVVVGQSVTQSLQLTNLSGVELSDVQFTVLGAPDNLTVTVTPPALAAVPGRQTRGFSYEIAAADASTTQADLTLRVTAAEGPVLDIPVSVRIKVPEGLLSAPARLETGMLRNRLTPVEFELRNEGGGETGEIQVLLPEVPWLTSASGAVLPSLAPGASTTVSLLLNPAATLPLGPYSGSLVLAPSNAAPLSVPFTFTAVSEATGELRVTVVDESTYFAAGAPKVAGARVSLVNPFTGQAVFQTQTDGSGTVTLPEVPEGGYELYVTAEGHDTSRGSVRIQPGQTNEQLVFLRSQLVTYNWTVVPVPFEDRYTVTIESQFQTNVPAPVIVVEPQLIDLAEITDGYEQIDFRITNHGLIAATDVELEFPTHPNWTFTPLIDRIDVLPAKSEVIIPVIVQRRALGGEGELMGAAAADDGPCTLTATVKWIVLCGPFGIPYSVPIPIINASGNCVPTPPPSGRGVGGIVGGGRIGPGVSGPAWTFSPPVECDCDPNSTEKFTLDISGFATAAAKAVSGAISEIDLGPVSVDADIGKVKGEVSIETCCTADGGQGFKVTGTGSISGEVKLTYYLVGGEVDQSWTDGVYNYEFTAGAGIPIEATAKLAGGVEVTKECEGDLKACAFAKLSLEVSVGPKILGELEMTQIVTGQTWKVGANASVSLQTGVSGEVRYCIGEGFSGKVCFDGLKFVAQISASGGPVGVSHSFEKTLVQEACYPAAQGQTLLAMLDSAGLSDDEIAWLAGYDSAEQMLAALSGGPAAELESDADPEPAAAVMPTGKPDDENGDGGDYPGTTCTTCGCGPLGAAAAAADGVCATVRLRLEQEVTMTRTAFEATLDVNNRADQPLEDLQVFISVVDAATGEVANDRFAFSDPARTHVSIGRQTEDGVWYVIPAGSSGSLVWTLLPTDEAAPLGPTQYTVGGMMTYVLGGQQYTVPLFPAPITVYPDAALRLKYFHQRDVFSDDPFTDPIEPSIPYDLGILVTNSGLGSARDLKIVSGQPRIIENEKGLLIDFEIVAAEVDGQPSPHALTTTFGEVAPGETRQGRWQLVSSLQGHFVEYTASFQHLTGLGDSRTSLIKSVEIYELIHTVRDARPGADLLPDFLVNEIQDDEDLPDTLHLSDGSVAPVGLGSVQSLTGTPQPGAMTAVVQASMPDGWGYLRLEDPSGGAYRLERVVRADGTEVPVDWNAWTTDRTFRFDGRRPVYEDRIHLLDYAAGDTQYTLHFRLDDDLPPSVLDVVDVAPDPRDTAVDSVQVVFSEEIDLSTFTHDDVTLRLNGGPNLIDSRVTIAHVAGGTYRIDGLADLTGDQGLYELSVAGAGVADYAGNAGLGSASDRWVNGQAPPHVTALVGVAPAVRNTPVASIDIVFSQPIDLASLDAADLTLTRDGGSDLLVGELELTQVDTSTYRLSGLLDLTSFEGTYLFTIDATGVQDPSGIAGIGAESAPWVMDTTPPTIVELQQVATNPRNTVVSSLDVTFSEPIDADSFGREDLTLRRNGTGPNLIDDRVTIQHVMGNRYRISGFNWVVGLEGDYQLSVSAAGVLDPAGNAGSGQAASSWRMDTTSPAAPSNLRIEPDAGPLADGITNVLSLTVAGDLAEPGLAVHLFDVTTQADLGRVNASGTGFSKPVIFSAAGAHRLRATAIDSAGNFSAESFFDVFVDRIAPTVSQVIGAPGAVAAEPVDTLTLVFSEDVYAADFNHARLLLTRDGGLDLIDAAVIVARTGSDRFEISGLGRLTGTAGDYRLSVDLSGVTDLAGNAGGQLVLDWRMQPDDVIPPNPPTDLRIDPDTGVSASDGRTNTQQIVLRGTVDDPGLQVELFDLTTGTELGAATLVGTLFSKSLVLSEGAHRLRARAVDSSGNWADSFFDVLVDLTRPTSTIQALPAQGGSKAIEIHVLGGDVSPAAGTETSGVAFFDIYVSVNQSAFSFWQSVPADNPTAVYQGQSAHTYGFRSIARDTAGNVETKPLASDASTRLPDLDAPATQIDSHTVDPQTGLVRLEFSGTDTGGSGFGRFQLWVQIDDQPPMLVVEVGGSRGSDGVYRGSAVYQAATDGVTRQYRFFTVGMDLNGNVELHAAAPADVTFSAAFDPPQALAVTGLDVQRGATQRSYIRYVDVLFNQSDGVQAIIDSLIGPGAEHRLRLQQYDLNGQYPVAVPLSAGMLSQGSTGLEIDFGGDGLGGNPNGLEGNGYYRLSIDADGDAANGLETDLYFYRLAGDVNGDRATDSLDLLALNAVLGNNPWDVNGDGSIDGQDLIDADANGDGSPNAADRLLVMRGRNKSLPAHLRLDD